mmetsp:Transcript_10993/g.12076  ORF Transcript_10993/g.12076 Transcript_10993/m.12076 type:complete len:190 (+) Transcript_10993:186-755(+)
MSLYNANSIKSPGGLSIVNKISCNVRERLFFVACKNPKAGTITTADKKQNEKLTSEAQPMNIVPGIVDSAESTDVLSVRMSSYEYNSTISSLLSLYLRSRGTLKAEEKKGNTTQNKTITITAVNIIHAYMIFSSVARAGAIYPEYASLRAIIGNENIAPPATWLDITNPDAYKRFTDSACISMKAGHPK